MTWITGLPASGTSTGEWDNTTITISAVGLAVGTYTRTITISAVGVPSQTIIVNLIVIPLIPKKPELTIKEFEILKGLTEGNHYYRILHAMRNKQKQKIEAMRPKL